MVIGTIKTPPWPTIVATGIQIAALLVGLTWQWGQVTARLDKLESVIVQRTANRYTSLQAAADQGKIVAALDVRDERIAQIMIELARLAREVGDKPPPWLLARVTSLEVEYRKLREEVQEWRQKLQR